MKTLLKQHISNEECENLEQERPWEIIQFVFFFWVIDVQQYIKIFHKNYNN